jgi:hypothetical protein
MAGMLTTNTQFMLRDQIYSSDLKQLLLDDLLAMRFVKNIENFPDGNTFNIPSLGEAEVNTYVEGQAAKYTAMDTGNFTFSFEQYIQSGTFISEKMRMDSFWAPQIEAAFVPRQHRALMENVETYILARPNASQTASNLNDYNGGDHRWVGGGLNETLTVEDFERARYSLTKANVPLSNLTAIVDPSTVYGLATSPNVSNFLTPMPMWEGVVRDGMTSGMKFRFNLGGFDIYTSNYLPNGISETVDGRTVTTGVANFLFSATPGDTLPIIGGFRQMPRVFTEFNKDLQQTEYLTTAYYDYKVYRPENTIVILTDTDQVG